MWKDFFYYSKSERRVILVLLVTLISILCLALYFRFMMSTIPFSASDCAIDSFLVQVRTADSLWYHRPLLHQREKSIEYHPFDPNTADSSQLRSLGLPVFMVRNILKYRLKGGVFRKPEDFSRIYGLTADQYKSLSPYIVIGEAYQLRNSDTIIKVDSQPRFTPVLKYPEGTIIELNTADTASLKKIPGIGSGFAAQIVQYRRRLGGFYSVRQLQEIRHLNDQVNRWFRIDTTMIRKIPINRSSIERLRNHPYMNFYKAKAILEYRRMWGKIEGLSQLSMFEEFTEEDLQRLSPYLSFE